MDSVLGWTVLLLSSLLRHAVVLITRSIGRGGTKLVLMWRRNLLMRGFHLLVMLVIGNNIKDTQCGFKVGWHLAAPHA